MFLAVFHVILRFGPFTCSSWCVSSSGISRSLSRFCSIWYMMVHVKVALQQFWETFETQSQSCMLPEVDLLHCTKMTVLNDVCHSF